MPNDEEVLFPTANYIVYANTGKQMHAMTTVNCLSDTDAGLKLVIMLAYIQQR